MSFAKSQMGGMRPAPFIWEDLQIAVDRQGVGFTRRVAIMVAGNSSARGYAWPVIYEKTQSRTIAKAMPT